jgi:hypothetical protein
MLAGLGSGVQVSCITWSVAGPAHLMAAKSCPAGCCPSKGKQLMSAMLHQSCSSSGCSSCTQTAVAQLPAAHRTGPMVSCHCCRRCPCLSVRAVASQHVSQRLSQPARSPSGIAFGMIHMKQQLRQDFTWLQTRLAEGIKNPLVQVQEASGCICAAAEPGHSIWQWMTHQ